VAGLTFAAPVMLNRGQAPKPDMDAAALQAIYRTPVKTLPAYTGVALPNGDYAIYKIIAVSTDEALRKQASQFLPTTLAKTQSEQIASDYVASLRHEIKVTIKQDVLDKVDERQ